MAACTHQREVPCRIYSGVGLSFVLGEDGWWNDRSTGFLTVLKRFPISSLKGGSKNALLGERLHQFFSMQILDNFFFKFHMKVKVPGVVSWNFSDFLDS